MNFELKALDMAGAAQEKCDALIVLVGKSTTMAADRLSALVSAAVKAGDLEDKPGKMLQLYRSDAAASARLVLVSMGEGGNADVKKAIAAAVSAAQGKTVGKVVVVSSEPLQPGAVRAVVLAAAEASYTYTTTKTEPQGRTLKKLVIGVAQAASWQGELKSAAAAVLGIEYAKEWANRPGNHATPIHLADAARELAKAARISCRVLGPKEVAKLGMGAFMAVARGSEEPLRLIVLQYRGAAKTDAPVVLVGKGITFDSGGISIKPAPEMDEMKFDMSGAASVLGVFKALGQLCPAINVVGLIPACENLPDGRAIKPGDVVTSMSGQTIEILNTDAEGRLVLCDALTYARRFKPRAVIDIATLTGACVIALGGVRSGLFSSDEVLAADLLASGDSAQDLCWRLPLDDEYGEGLKTNFADVANVAGRAGGSVTAAKFLQRFTKGLSWAHLDIAGTAWKSGQGKGATGRPVGLLLDYLLKQDPKT